MARRHTTQFQTLGAEPHLFEELVDLRPTQALGCLHLEVGDRCTPIPESTDISDDLKWREPGRLMGPMQPIGVRPERAGDFVEFLAEASRHGRRSLRIESLAELPQ